MNNNLSDNLNLLMAKARLNSSELARLTGLPATTIKRIRNNEQSNPTISTLAPIANYFAISLHELLTGTTEAPSATNPHSIPLRTWDTVNAPHPTGTEAKYIATELALSEGSYALMVDDADLAPFPKGALLIIDRHRTPETSDYVIVSKANAGIATIKKLIIEMDQAYLKSLLPGVEITPLTEAVIVLGVITQYKINLK